MPDTLLGDLNCTEEEQANSQQKAELVIILSASLPLILSIIMYP